MKYPNWHKLNVQTQMKYPNWHKLNVQTHDSCDCHLNFIDVHHTFCLQILFTVLCNKTQEQRLLLQIKLIRMDKIASYNKRDIVTDGLNA